ncbi:radial spoke 3 protein (macronuclear) [Tetrahymena thermophila SB210]|uniref:Radial spoke 3 protein n=1 Tax=Tetrahymena thermophila (strain SB210) TaxID=312017 RepID=Q22NW8_TETTS|nr:radial spoke 3 protein [Tetrahymena thermophila SB210]EAR87043.2 radial spoke 3 protein [Tetrahymena thermophila SB210]|eukprot:XP_001007288.2 radial spoke 3 protein [Tetrahymena thermophila SB210]
MQQRILCLGLDNAGKSSLVNRLKFGDAGQQVPTQNINVSQMEFNGTRYAIYEVGGEANNRESWREYIQNSQGIIFVVDGSDDQRYDEARQYIQSIIEEPQLAEVPLLLYLNKQDKGGSIKKIASDLGLNMVSDREIFIQGSDAVSGVGVNIGFDWLSKQLISKKKLQNGYSFDAEPKVVKGRQKYKQEEEIETKSQQTFALLMQDKKVKMMNPVQQEQEYVRLEKERIKIENMNAQLINFKKNKKRMAPYDIKPSPNPRIDVNLEFFLTDNINTIPPIQAEIDCQTDDFIPKPPSPKYVPKKTGIDAYTQVEDYELFDFDREVTPIVDVIVTKTLEQSMLEIEQDEEILNMRKFKRQYDHRRDAEKKKTFQIYEREVNTMKEKDRLLDLYRQKENQKIDCLHRVQNYSIARNYLRDVKVNAISKLYNAGYYPNDLKISIETDFIDWLVEETSKEIQERKALKDSITNTFDQITLHQLREQKQPHLKVIEKKKRKAAERRINDSQNTRLIRVCFKDTQKLPTHFGKHINRFLEGTLDEWKETFNTKYNALQEQVDNSEITEEQRAKILEEEFPEITNDYFGFSVNNLKKIGFTLAHSQFYVQTKKDRLLELVAFAIQKDGKIISRIDKDNLRPNNQNPSLNKYIRYKRNIRDLTKKASDDEAIVVDFSKVPDDVWGFFFFVKLPNLNLLADKLEKENEVLKNSRMGIEDYSNNIAIDGVNLMEKIQFDQLIQQPPSEESPTIQNSYYLGYSLTKRPITGWYLENIKIASKGMFEQAEEQEYLNKLVSFWTSTEGIPPKNIEASQVADGEEANVNGSPAQANNLRVMENQSQMSLSNGTQFFQKCYKEYKVEFAKNENGELTANGKNYEEFIEELSQYIQSQDAALDALCQWGFEFYFRGKLLKRLQTLKKCKNAFEFEVKKKPEPIVEKVENGEEGEEGEGEEGEEEPEED